MSRLQSAYLGEDVPATITYEDDAGNAVDPDDTASDPTITITAEDDTEVVSAIVMTQNGTGDFEYVWDTSTDASGTGVYEIAITADSSSETKIVKQELRLQ